MKKRITTFAFPAQFLKELKIEAAKAEISMTQFVINGCRLLAEKRKEAEKNDSE